MENSRRISALQGDSPSHPIVKYRRSKLSLNIISNEELLSVFSSFAF